MTLTVLLPLDGSEFAEAAIPTAAKVVREANGRLVLFRAFPAPVKPLYDESGQIIAYVDQIEADERKDLLDYLSGVASRIEQQYQVANIQTEAQPGEPVLAIIDAARASNADLIVMATHGRTGVARVVMGSVAGTVLRRSGLPTTLIRPAMLPDTADADRPAAAVNFP